jgi:hypothetical protein
MVLEMYLIFLVSVEWSRKHEGYAPTGSGARMVSGSPGSSSVLSSQKVVVDATTTFPRLFLSERIVVRSRHLTTP